MGGGAGWVEPHLVGHDGQPLGLLGLGVALSGVLGDDLAHGLGVALPPDPADVHTNNSLRRGVATWRGVGGGGSGEGGRGEAGGRGGARGEGGRGVRAGGEATN